MGHLHMKLQGLESNRKTATDTELEENFKTNVVLCATVEPSTTQEGKIYSDLCGRFPIMTNKGNRYIYVMYVYYCNAIMTNPTKNRSDK